MLRKLPARSCLIFLATHFTFLSGAQAVDLFFEDFEGLTLNPVVTLDTEIRNAAAWTDVPPADWTVDDTGVTSVGNPLLGAVEFEGWSFVDKNWWITTAGDQDRSQFYNSRGIIAVADPDEWDDFPDGSTGLDSPDDNDGVFDARLITPQIQLQGASENTAKVFFHSSWRPEDTQKAMLTATYNDPANTQVELLRWESESQIEGSPNPLFKADAPSEGLTFDLMNPAGASTVQLEFRVFEARNDWWWAIDNVRVFTGDEPAADNALKAVIDRDTQNVKIVNNTGEPVDLYGYSIRSAAGAFDEENAVFKSASDSDWLRGTRFDDNVNDLGEFHVTSDPLADQAEIDFGNVWRKFIRDESDISFQYLSTESDTPIAGDVQFVGNNDQSYQLLDLNFNGAIEILDWEEFKSGFGTELAGLTSVQRYQLGDLDNDGQHTVSDFFLFSSLYDAANGEGAFALAVASAVPEPLAASLLVWATVCLLGCRRSRISANLLSLVLVATAFALANWQDNAHAQLRLFAEDFEGLTLGPNVEEAEEGSEVWTNVPPAGWTIDNSGMPGLGDPETDGVVEWAGWAFADRVWWASVDDQRRSEFTRAQGTVMIADADEWEDAATVPGNNPPFNLYDTFISTPTIEIPAGIPAGRLKLSFDSSWRDEGMDDLDSSNNQTGTITVSYDAGPKVEVLNWDSDPESDAGPGQDPRYFGFHDDNPNERISQLDLAYNGSATTLQLEFSLTNAWNDWWWALDNIAVEVPADPSILRIDTRTGQGFVVGGDVIPTPMKFIDITSANGVLRGDTVTGFSAGNSDNADGPDDGNVAGDSAGEQWELLTADNLRIAEACLFCDSTFDSSRTVSLGPMFAAGTSTENRDVQFSYTTPQGDTILGVVEYFESMGGAGDYNNDGLVNAADYTVWRDNLGSSVTLPNESATPGVVTAEDFNVWKSNYGTLSGAGRGAVAVPEPTRSALFFTLLAIAASYRLRPTNFRWKSTAWVFACWMAAQGSVTALAVTLDRDYRFGDTDTGAADGMNVGAGTSNGATFDSAGQPGMNQLIDLLPFGQLFIPPKYIAVDDRPDGVSGLGIELNPNQFGIVEEQSLQTGFEEALNFPERSPSSTFTPGGTIDYSFISDRGFQLWAKPTMIRDSHIVMDTNQHGVLINQDGIFAMRYAGIDYPSSVIADTDTWYHLSVVRPFTPGNGSILFVNGVAAAAANGEYLVEKGASNIDGNPEFDATQLDTSPLVVGANTSNNAASVGKSSFFSGIVDDLEMFVMGITLNGTEYGEYQFVNDNGFAAAFRPQVDGDLTGDDLVTLDDAMEFANNWLSEKRLTWTNVNGSPQSLVVGDLESRGRGDFNYDGRVNLSDWVILHNANPSAAAAAMQFIQFGTIPEPTTACLLLAMGMWIAVFFVRRRRMGHICSPT